MANNYNQNFNQTNTDYTNPPATNTYQQQNYQPPQPPNPNYCPQQQPVEEKASVGLAILSFIIPLAGLIIFLTQKDKKPKTAKVSGICALVSFILNIFIAILITIASTVFVGTAVDNAVDTPDTIPYETYNFENFESADSNELSLPEFTYEINVGDTCPVSVLVPSGYSENDLIWNSSDTSIATIDKQGNLSGVSEGVVSISVETTDGQYYDFCMVTVSNPD